MLVIHSGAAGLACGASLDWARDVVAVAVSITQYTNSQPGTRNQLCILLNENMLEISSPLRISYVSGWQPYLLKLFDTFLCVVFKVWKYRESHSELNHEC